MSRRSRTDRLAEAVRAIACRRRPPPPAPTAVGARDDAQSRLDAIEREVQEMRGRVNALFFAVITAGVADLVARTVLK